LGGRHTKPGPRQLTIFDGPATEGRRSVTYPRPDFRPDPSRGLAWCPYCAAVILFAWDPRLREPRCPRCSIGATDYYVAQINRLFTEKALETFAAAVRRSGLIFDRPLFFERGDNRSGD